MNTAQVLVELLKEYRVEHIFGVPGDTTMGFYDALLRALGYAECALPIQINYFLLSPMRWQAMSRCLSMYRRYRNWKRYLLYMLGSKHSNGRMPQAGKRKAYSSISYAAEWQTGSNVSKLIFESR